MSKTWMMIVAIADIKGWKIETEWNQDAPEDEWGVVRKLEENWKAFSKGDHVENRGRLEANKQNPI